ncbi:MAG TPA: type II toxin-antitoxin system prevent-host-death family antitoxin [bacterium]|nr:type II toxin-antitoxin system prevent-host-death family antitoxin [bacterium]
MKITNIYEAKTHFSKLIEAVLNGREIIIGKAGKPVAKLVPYQPPSKNRQGGQWKGKVRMADDFDTLPDDIAAAFRGETP